MKVVAEPWA